MASKKRQPLTVGEPAGDATIPATVRGVLIDVLGIDDATITRDATIVEDLGADSLDLVEIAMALEEQYGVAIDDEVVETWGIAVRGTVAGILDALEKAGARV